MAEIKSYPNNQDEYSGAEDVMRWLHGRTSGVFAADSNAAVTALSTPGMAINVSDGTGWITNANSDGVVWWNDNESINGSKLQLAIDAADGVLNRIDRIIVEWKTTNYVDRPEIKVLKGSLSSTAAAPALTNNSTKRQISLARVSVPAGTTAITASMITDERLDGSVCGLVTDGLSVDTTTIQAQFEAFLTAIQGELSALEAGTAVELKHLEFHDVSVTASGWAKYTPSGTEETALYAEGYEYRKAVALSGVTAAMTPDVTPGISADDCGASIWRAAQAYAGGIYLYADAAPDAAFALTTVNMWKAGA